MNNNINNMNINRPDYNVDNYEITELIDILDLDYPVTKEDIQDASLFLIKKYQQSKQLLMVAFIKDVREKLDEYMFENNIDHIDNNKYGLLTNFAVKPKKDNSTFVEDRKDHNVTIIDNDHQTMQRNRINFPLEPKQGYMNQILHNTDTKIINIDSHYRDNLLIDASGYNEKSSSTDFMVNFNEPLTNVISMKLYSYEIPIHWYTFSPKYGTTKFVINDIIYQIPEGNYNITDLINIIQSVLPTGIFISHNLNSNKVTIDSSGGSVFSMAFYNNLLLENHHTSYCSTGKHNFTERSGPKIDYNLGWLLGFRNTSYLGANTYTSEAIVDIIGIKYIYITIDDFNRNHNTKQVSNLYQDKETLKLPKYYNHYNDANCVNDVANERNSITGNKLTQAQLFAINQIIINNDTNDLDRHTGNVDSDIMARINIPYNNGNLSLYRHLTSQESSLSNNIRNYYGPVTIKRMRVRLIDDKGNDIDLNNTDWSFSLIVEQLYQY